MGSTKYKMQHVFSARKHAMKLARTVKLNLAKRAADNDRGDVSSSAASATPLPGDDCVATSSGVPSASSAQEQLVSSAPAVPSASTLAIVASNYCLVSVAMSDNASSTAHLEMHFLMPEEIEALEAQRAAVEDELGTMPATLRHLRLFCRVILDPEMLL